MYTVSVCPYCCIFFNQLVFRRFDAGEPNVQRLRHVTEHDRHTAVEVLCFFHSAIFILPFGTGCDLQLIECISFVRRNRERKILSRRNRMNSFTGFRLGMFTFVDHDTMTQLSRRQIFRNKFVCSDIHPVVIDSFPSRQVLCAPGSNNRRIPSRIVCYAPHVFQTIVSGHHPPVSIESGLGKIQDAGMIISCIRAQ